MRTTRRSVTFHNPFSIKAHENLPPGTYDIKVEEEEVSAGPLKTWQEKSLMLCISPAETPTASQQWIAVDPAELKTELEEDAAVEAL